MNSWIYRSLIFPALLTCASGAWAQCHSPVIGQENIAALKQQAASGEADAQCGLGRMYEFGWGVPQDFTKAAIWLRKAAEQGSALSQMDLGTLYAIGQGVPQDYAEAYFWFDLAVAGKLDSPDAENAMKDRDQAASRLIPTDLSRAQERARKWFEDHPAKP